MNSSTSPNDGSNKSQTKWSEYDDAEYNRLSAEMNEDSKLQFSLFTFGITASTAVLGLLTIRAFETNPLGLSWLSPGSFLLLPLIVLFPTSLVILNRAKTRNRKVSYIIINFDYRRLIDEGITKETPLQDVRQKPFIPWETALHILDRTNPKDNRHVHIPPSLWNMTICYSFIEILCIALAIFVPGDPSKYTLIGLGIITLIFVYIIRFRELRSLRGRTSIQGYVEHWLKYKYDTGEKAPLYLRQWIEEFNEGKKRDVLRP